MKYIDKNRDLQAGHRVTDDYLSNYCRVDDGDNHYHYQNIDYDGTFGSSHSKAAMQQMALNSQENYCCYCMRDLHLQNQQVTLEHIIPQHCNTIQFNNYIGLNVSPLTGDAIIRTGDFTGVTDVQVPPRPHSVTYENLVASCDGSFPDREGTSQCCNHRRGERDVYPLFYITGVEDEISYMEDGTMQPNAQCGHTDEYRSTIDHVRLNCPNLKDVRRLWHLFRDIDYNDLVACLDNKDRRDHMLKQVLFQDNGLIEQDARILTKFMKDAYWQTFLLYHWFHNRI